MEDKQSSISIIIIGAGGIVQTAHLPAYRLAGFQVKGLYDMDQKKAHDTAGRFGIPNVYASMHDLVQVIDKNTIVDIAVPANRFLEILDQLPDGATVLMQKPMGESLEEAIAIRSLCHAKQITAGVNFQLRYAPFINAARNLITKEALGEICDIEINVNVYTPWHLWEFLYDAPRVEILYHSIHYIDLVRSFLGNPSGVFAQTSKHPDMMKLASVKSNIMMDYGPTVRASILTNHAHKFGSRHQQSYIKFEGTKGAIFIKMGALIDYPSGGYDSFEFILHNDEMEAEWQAVQLEGNWFPHAFIGAMQEMINSMNKVVLPNNSIEDCIDTMAVVEAAYASCSAGIQAINYNY